MATHRKPRVVYWQNIPSPYFVGRFNALADRGNLDFEAWFNEEREPDRSWEVTSAEWRFAARYIPARSIMGRRLHVPVAELRQVRPDVLVALYDRASFAVGSIAARRLASRVAFRVLPNYDTWAGRSWWRELSKHFLFHSIDGAKVPGPDGAALAQRYGLPRRRAFAVTQSIDVAHYSRARHMDPALREERRRQLRVDGCVFIYVGRLWQGKGLDYLIEAYRSVRSQRADVSLLILGDGVDEDRYRNQACDLPGVTFAGFIQPRNAPDYYALADVFVFPTLGDPHGLVIDEAMAAGLPIISTAAAGDIRRRLPDGQAGYVVPPADAQALAERMLLLASDPDRRRRFTEEGLRLVTPHVHEQWARDFEAFIDHLQATPARRTLAAGTARRLGGLLCALEERSSTDAAPYIASNQQLR